MLAVVGTKGAGKAAKGATAASRAASAADDVARLADDVARLGDDAARAADDAARGTASAADDVAKGADGVVVTGQGKLPEQLLPGEGNVGTFRQLTREGTPGDNITPHHMPSDTYMRQHRTNGQPTFPGYTRNGGTSMNMQQPHPGTGGRHRRTATYGKSPDLSLSPREALARDIRDARRIYQQDGLYSPQIRSSLQEVIRQNRAAWPDQFGRPPVPPPQ